MNELNFTVLGLRGVGKTTLITSMYEQTVKCLKGTGLNLHADLATSTALSRYLAQLQKVADETKAIVKHGGIAGGASEKEYLFSLGPNGKRADLDIRFTDFPGGWMMDPSKQERVIEIGAKADVLLIPIDSPPLMEKKGRYHDEINAPSLIKTFINEIQKVTDDGKSRLVILAPIRCEKYVKGVRKADELLGRVREEYDSAIECFCDSKTSVVITPIQTVGCLQFSNFGQQENGDDFLEMNFRKTKASDRYSPVDCDQPMRYLLRFLLKRQHEAKSGGWWDWLTFGWFADKHYIHAVQEISKGCKNGFDGFEIVQGEHLL